MFKYIFMFINGLLIVCLSSDASITRSVYSDETEVSITFSKDAYEQFEPIIIKRIITNHSTNSRYYDEDGTIIVVRHIDGSQVDHEISVTMPMTPDDAAWLYKNGESRSKYFELNENFGSPLEPGDYKLNVTYKASDNVKNAWCGKIEIKNLIFKVIPPVQKVHDLAPLIKRTFYSTAGRSRDDANVLYLLSALKGTSAYNSIEYRYIYYISSRTKDDNQRLELYRSAVERQDLPQYYRDFYKMNMIEHFEKNRSYKEASDVLSTMEPNFNTVQKVKEIQKKRNCRISIW